MSFDQLKPELSSLQSTEQSMFRLNDKSTTTIDDTETSSISHPSLDPNRRLSIIPSTHFPPNYTKPEKNTHFPTNNCSTMQAIDEVDEQLVDQTKSSMKIDTIESIKTKSNSDEDDEEIFDQIILNHFVPFSGAENVVCWLQQTEKKFTRFKFSRKQRFLAIPLLLTSDARLKYIKAREQILSFDDFYAYLLTHYEKSVGFTDQTLFSRQTTQPFHSSSTFIDQSSITSKNQSNNTLNHSSFSPKPPILRSTAISDLTFDNPSTSSNRHYADPEFSNSTISLNNTTNDLRKAILESFIKTPKTFQGGKEDVSKWLEDLDHLFNVAHIPNENKLDLISYALKGDALQWYKNTKSILTTWEIFVEEIKKAFTSSFRQELSFKRMESYCQGPYQSIRNYYNEMLKLCAEADPTMTESTKLKHLLSKAKSSIQFEVRRRKPNTPAEFLEYAREAEELFQLSNITSDNFSLHSSQTSSSRQEIDETRIQSSGPDLQSSSSRSADNQPAASSIPRFTPAPNYTQSPSRTYSQNENDYRRNSQGQTTKHFPRNHPSPPDHNHPSTIRNAKRLSSYPSHTASHISPLMKPNILHYVSKSSPTNHNEQIKKTESHKPSLIFLQTMVNGQSMKILIDTGATTTFISEASLLRINPPLRLQSEPTSFVLADGIAPFQTLGMVKLSVLFAKQHTPIRAHVVANLCTDMIIGMDYINRYSLNINITDQTLSIRLYDKTFYMSINQESTIHSTPLILPDSVKLARHQSISIHIPIPPKNCFFIPHPNFSIGKNSIVAMELFQPESRSTALQLFNLSPSSQYLRKGICLGHLHKPLQNHSILPVICAVTSSGDATSFTGELSESSDVSDCITRIPISSCFSNILPQHLQPLIEHIIPTNDRAKLSSLLSCFRNVFDTSKHNIASTSISHVIRTIPHSPPASKAYPNPDKEEALYNIIQEFLAAGLIAESHSPYAAPAILVKKPDGSHRLVVDYKKLNLITIKDSSPLPNMEDIIRKLGFGYSHFSKLDLKSGFYQIPIHEEDKIKTAFITPFGLYHFNVLPMGLRNSPPTFQKVMTDALKACRSFSLVYLDDIVVFSSSYDEHLVHLEMVFKALQSRRIVLNPPKCTLATTQINYLGHIVSSDVVKPNSEKIQAILDIPEPKTLAQANKFLGALSWYRKFLPNFATVAAPLHTITNLPKSLRHKFKWTPLQSESFHQLKYLLTSTPLFLHFPVADYPLILTTDASNVGLGGVLQQEINGERHNLYYHSQLLSSCQRKYSTIEKEALAILKCFERMRPYLLGRNIILMTDHCPLCSIMTKTVHNNRVARISTLIQEYNITQVLHIKGKENCLPDFLSRYPHENNDDLLDDDYGIQSKTSNYSEHNTQKSPEPVPIAAMTLRPRPITTQSSSKFHPPKHSSPQRSLSEQFPSHSFKRSCNYFDMSRIQSEQSTDTHIQQTINDLKENSTNSSFVIKNKILHKLLSPSVLSKRKTAVIYLPFSLIQPLLQAMHDDPLMGSHFSMHRMLYKIRFHYWWPHMKSSIERYVRSCRLCAQHNISRQKPHGHLSPIPPPPGPFQLIGIDYCGPFKLTPRGNKYVLVITDYFTRHVTAISLPNCTADITALTLFNEYFCKFGIPTTILSDQGSHFCNHLMKNLQHLIGYHHIYSSTYHPQTNGVTERFNATFVPQIAKLQDINHNNWDDFLPAVVFAYNTGIHRTTRYSPYELLFGRRARLPIESPPNKFSFPSPNDYFQHLQKCLKLYSRFATANVLQQQQQTKLRYDMNRSDSHFVIGDKVLVKIPGMKSKLDPKFSSTTHTVIHSNHPTYFVRNDYTNVESRVHMSDLRSLLIR